MAFCRTAFRAVAVAAVLFTVVLLPAVQAKSPTPAPAPAPTSDGELSLSLARAHYIDRYSYLSKSFSRSEMLSFGQFIFHACWRRESYLRRKKFHAYFIQRRSNSISLKVC